MYLRRNALVALLAVVCAGVIAACGSSSSSTSSSSSAPSSTGTTSAAANAAVAKLVPAAIKSKGTITVAADASYAPDEFFASDGKTVIGMDPDLVQALGAAMGLKVNVVNATFDSIIPGLASGKFDMGASSFSDTKAREKTVDFVDYASVGESFYTKTQGGTSIASINDICGKTVAVQKATTEQMDAQTQNGKCTKAGKPPAHLFIYTLQTDVNLALTSGRAQLGFADTPVAAYQVKKTGGQFKLVGSAYATGPYGLAIPRNPANAGFALAVLAAMKALVANGTYSSVLAKWGLQGIAVPASAIKINGATS